MKYCRSCNREYANSEIFCEECRGKLVMSTQSKNGKTGLLVPEKKPDEISNAIIKVFSDRKLSSKLVVNGQKHVKISYSWDIVTGKFIKLIQDILHQKLFKTTALPS